MSVPVLVYASRKRPETFVYVPQRSGTQEDEARTAEQDLAELPAALRDTLAPWRFALAFELSETRTLAQADSAAVLAALAEQGFYLQMPPAELPGGDA
ncbi:MAG: YcgL domain-containing protein [Pseudomonadota bacterium]